MEEEIPEFRIKQKWEYDEKGEEYESEYLQVRNALRDNKKSKANKKLGELHKLRKMADYNLFNPITEENITEALKYMNSIFDELNFKN